ncbi:MAG TPA: hypothetical protein PKL73_13250 [Polyangiaceae bacterium]|nr:hypothetical protein [Polyangiaceae bacterium]HOE50580.1 hypothetical protein [Polyangiaceae bacterium]
MGNILVGLRNSHVRTMRATAEHPIPRPWQEPLAVEPGSSYRQTAIEHGARVLLAAHVRMVSRSRHTEVVYWWTTCPGFGDTKLTLLDPSVER